MRFQVTETSLSKSVSHINNNKCIGVNNTSGRTGSNTTQAPAQMSNTKTGNFVPRPVNPAAEFSPGQLHLPGEMPSTANPNPMSAVAAMGSIAADGHVIPIGTSTRYASPHGVETAYGPRA